MIVETTPQTQTDAAHRLVYLLEEKEREIQGFADAISQLKKAHNSAIDRLDHDIRNARNEILSGQTNFVDVMTEIGHDRPINGDSQ